MGKERTCQDCGGRCAGERCQRCSNKKRAKDKESGIRKCFCGRPLARGTKGDKCYRHRDYNKKAESLSRVLYEEARVAPRILPEPHFHGEWLIISDPHFPFHKPETIEEAVDGAELLGVKQLMIPGDIIHADSVSKYANSGKLVELGAELVATGRIMAKMVESFDKIVLLKGNHDQRIEKIVAKWSKTSDGQRQIDLWSKMLDVAADPEGVADGILGHFLANENVYIDPLTSATINNEWKVLHPGSCSRVSPQNERKLAEKFRKSVIGGHNHLFGVGFDASGEDIAFNCGHASDDEKFRYIPEKITTFPKTVRGWGYILCSESAPRGRLLPVADHPKWFKLRELAERLR